MDRRVFLARLLLAALSVGSTAAASVLFSDMLGEDGWSLVDFPLTALFSILFLWTSLSFWSATFGFLHRLRSPVRRPSPAATGSAGGAGPGRLPRTALLMPIYNEDASRALAGLRAIHESLAATGHGDRFDFFVLSDTTDPDIWLKEEIAWAHHKTSARGESGIYYRRRPMNRERKSGNIADFCRAWGPGYTYMVVLDADSIMSGETLLEIVRRMESDPRIGILQVPPVPVNSGSVFARIQQFAAAMYGDIFTSGYALWTQVDGNYWGHNAIIRVKPFIECCGLSRLPGRPPLGGEVLSHDFVEAALMRRAGWEVRIATDLDGSYEECPATVTDFVRRDRRWCQGNLQHIRLIFAYGFNPMSRVHFGLGAMSYLSSPLWLVFLLFGFLGSIGQTSGLHDAAQVLADHRGAPELFIATLVTLFLPKLWGLLLVLLGGRERLRAFGGPFRAALSIFLESLVSMLTAPIFMVHNVVFVASTLAGRSVEWRPQRRGEGSVRLRDAARDCALHTAGGFAAGAATALLAPAMFWWTLPISLGLVASAPMSAMLASAGLGRRLRRLGIFVTPQEAEPPEVLRRQHRHLRDVPDLLGSDPETRFRMVIADPVLNALHRAVLAATSPPGAPSPRLPEVRRAVLEDPSCRLRREDKLALLADGESLRVLHAGAWARWPSSLLVFPPRAG